MTSSARALLAGILIRPQRVLLIRWEGSSVVIAARGPQHLCLFALPLLVLCLLHREELSRLSTGAAHGLTVTRHHRKALEASQINEHVAQAVRCLELAA